MKLTPILCLNFGPIGDTLIMLALFDDILSAAPEATFTVITSSNAPMIRNLAAAYPSVTVVDIPSQPLKLLAFIWGLLRHSWIVLVPGTARFYSFHLSAFLLALSVRPGNLTIGFGDIRKRSGWLPFNKPLFVDLSMSVLDNYRRMTRFFLPGAHLIGRPVTVHLRPVEPHTFPYQAGKYFVIHMFGTRPRLSFPPKRWRLLLEEIAREYPGYGIVLTGGAKDKSLIEEVSAGVPNTLIEIGRPILEVAWIIDHAAAYIGVDTGVTHLAAVLHKSSVVVGNNSNPLWLPRYNPEGEILLNLKRCTCTGDKNDNCRVYEDGVGYHYCTYDITIEDVMHALKDKVTPP